MRPPLFQVWLLANPSGMRFGAHRINYNQFGWDSVAVF
jgi:hypothetical protein